MSQEHTSEPWDIFATDHHGHETLIGGMRRLIACTRTEAGYLSADDPEANARRIVACVNACQGLPTDRLEQVAQVPIDLRLAILRAWGADLPLASESHSSAQEARK